VLWISCWSIMILIVVVWCWFMRNWDV